jgi:hypothetical protein
MDTMQCQELEQVLDQRSAGTLTPEAAAHVEACANCRALVSDLDAIQEAAGRLGQEDLELAPPERLWVNLRAQLEAEGLIRESREDKERVTAGWFGVWWGGISRPALAGAYVALLLVAAVFVGLKSDFGPGASQQTAMLAAATASVNSELKDVESGAMKGLPKGDPDLSATLRHNLEVVDNFIALCEKSVREEPKSELAREYLYGAYQQKAELLSAMMDRGVPGE